MQFAGAALAEFPRTQLATSNPEKWDSEWEDFFQNNKIMSNLAVLFQKELIMNSMSTGGLDSVYHAYRIFLVSTCTIQQRIGHLSLIDQPKLKSGWNNATVAERRQHLLIALASVCSTAKNLNDARAFCARELRVKKLSEDPKILLDLLAHIVPGSQYIFRPPETPTYIQNDDWDALSARQAGNASEMDKATLASMLMLRTKLIYLVVECTFLSLLGREFYDITVLKQKGIHQTKPPTKPPVNPLREMIMGTKAAKATEKDDRKAQRERASARDVFCEGCGKMESNASTKFMQCGACKNTMQRYVPYCSKECQKRSWKTHKPICGKPMSFETIQESERERNKPLEPIVGPPVNGFKRSLALEYHIMRLTSMTPGFSCPDVFLHIGPKEVVEHVFPWQPQEVRDLLLSVRNTAMTRGDRPSVAVFVHYVVWNIATTRYPPEKASFGEQKSINNIVKQFSEEFEYPLPELKAAVLDLQRQQAQDACRRPPALKDLHPVNWMIYIKSNPFDPHKRFEL